MFRRSYFGNSPMSPWREMARLQREMNRLFSDSFPAGNGHSTSSYPAMNVWTNQDGAIVTAELPGVEAEDIDISVVGETLTLSGSRQADELQEGEKYHRRERGFGNFSRTLQLPFRVDGDKVEASFEKGILHIQLPRVEQDKPKKITVRSA